MFRVQSMLGDAGESNPYRLSVKAGGTRWSAVPGVYGCALSVPEPATVVKLEIPVFQAERRGVVFTQRRPVSAFDDSIPGEAASGGAAGVWPRIQFSAWRARRPHAWKGKLGIRPR